MDYNTFFSNSKWEILQEISKNSKSPIELSKILKTSVPNVSQQLRLMEAMNLVDKKKIINYKKGKPRTKYHIKHDFTYFIRLGKNIAEKQYIKHDSYLTYIFNVISIFQKRDQIFCLKMFFDNIDLLNESSIGVMKNSEENIELFILTEELELAREKLSNIKISSFGKTRNIICWCQSSEEVEIGLKKRDPYYINLINDSKILIDYNNKLINYKEDESYE